MNRKSNGQIERAERRSILRQSTDTGKNQRLYLTDKMLNNLEVIFVDLIFVGVEIC
jgi:hypothetical protein